MKGTKGLFRLGAIALALSLVVLTGCSTDDSKDPYKLSWGVVSGSYSSVSNIFSSNGVTLTTAGSNAGYVAGEDATTAYNALKGSDFNDSGTETG